MSVDSEQRAVRRAFIFKTAGRQISCVLAALDRKVLSTGAVACSWKYVVGADKNGNHRYNHGCALPDNEPDDGEADGRRHVVLSANVINHIDTADAEYLFRQLGKGGDCGLSDAIEIAVDAGVDRCHGNGEGYNAQQGGRSWFHKEGCGNPIRIGIDI